MGDNAKLIEDLRARVRELEDKMEALRLGRRVLMNLLESVEAEKRGEVERLKTQNEQLKNSNRRYAKSIMSCNLRIVQLQDQLSKMADKQQRGNTFT
ncbi:MAG: translation initiation factor 2 [Firmicutes bacterium]|nr:translation initiation factor 2 [Bacillota bacterium]